MGLRIRDSGVMTKRTQDTVLVAVLTGIAGLAGVIMMLLMSSLGTA
ncbi:hypothetical protein SAMN05216506_10396 [Saccharopolyspora kobensis]|uniref:Uncharacterized protein n=1 Tax=Saccharopolyspora kobensis TaxID=146035 RepID=A0ABY1DV82_9PSEU|nr:hypothetical protein SAMN05216506_10396 [Saccharopolyspora kobensis]